MRNACCGSSAQEGNALIFATSFGFMNATAKVAKALPKVYFEHATGYMRGPNLATYNARFYEGRAVVGTIAGMMSKTGVGGYVASFPIPEVVMGINCFTLAARKVNPKFQTKVLWLSTWYDPAKEADAAKALADQGADIITQHTDSPAPLQVCEQKGLYGFGQASDMSAIAPKAHLTAIVDNWAPYYIGRVKAVMDGTWKTGDTWWGLKQDTVQIAPYNAAMPDNIKKAADEVKNAIIAGTLHPVTGPINDNKGAPEAQGRRKGDRRDAREDELVTSKACKAEPTDRRYCAAALAEDLLRRLGAPDEAPERPRGKATISEPSPPDAALRMTQSSLPVNTNGFHDHHPP